MFMFYVYARQASASAALGRTLEDERRLAVVLRDTMHRLRVRAGGSTSTLRYCDEIIELSRDILCQTSSSKYERLRHLLPFNIAALATLRRRERARSGVGSAAEDLQWHVHTLVAALDSAAADLVATLAPRDIQMPRDIARDLISSSLVLNFDEMTAHRSLALALDSGRARGRVGGVAGVDTASVLLRTEQERASGVGTEQVGSSLLNFVVRSLFTGFRATVSCFLTAGAASTPQLLMSQREVETRLFAAGFRLFAVVSDAATTMRAAHRADDIDSHFALDLVTAEREYRAELAARGRGLPTVKYTMPSGAATTAGRCYAQCGGGGQTRFVVDRQSRPNPRNDDREAVIERLSCASQVRDALSPAVSTMVPDSQHVVKRIGTALRSRNGIMVIRSDKVAAIDKAIDRATQQAAKRRRTATTTTTAGREARDSATASTAKRDARIKFALAEAESVRWFGRVRAKHFDDVAEFGGSSGRRHSVDVAGALLGPAAVHTGLYDKRVSGAGMAPMERSRLAMDVPLHLKLFSEPLRRTVHAFVRHGGDDALLIGGPNAPLTAEQRAAQEERSIMYAPLIDFVDNLAPFIRLINSNEQMALDALERTIWPAARDALDFLDRADCGTLLDNDLRVLISLWLDDLPTFWRDFVDRRDFPDGFVAQISPLRLTQAFCERLHGIMRGASSMNTVTHEQASATAKAFNRGNSGQLNTAKDARRVRKRAATVHTTSRARAARKAAFDRSPVPPQEQH